MRMNFVILIPAYRPDEKFTAFAAVLLEQNMAVLVVDDGSGPDCDSFFRQAEALGCTVVRHEKNMGKGRAIKTGLQAVKAAFPEAECVITADCDGQHTAESIRTVMRAAAENPQCVILGGRFQEKDSSVPLKSRIGNDFTRGVFRLATGLRIHDTQTGLRAVPAAYIDKMAGLKGERYEYEMNMLLALREYAIPYREVPIPTIYPGLRIGIVPNPEVCCGVHCIVCNRLSAVYAFHCCRGNQRRHRIYPCADGERRV